jgi:vacuolar-type H+-ATPase subunit C/Vma6
MAAPVAAISVLGGMSTFNMAHGFVEALVRGMRSSFLLDADYHHLTQCENLEVIFNSFIMTVLRPHYRHPSLQVLKM